MAIKDHGSVPFEVTLGVELTTYVITNITFFWIDKIRFLR